MAGKPKTINPTPTNGMRNKLFFVVFAVILVMTGYICTQLFETAVINAEYYRARANAQQLKPFTIPANRGTIYDRNGKILAQSKTVWKIIISPTTIRKNSAIYQEQRERAAHKEYNNALSEGLPAIAPVSGTVYDEADEICRALADIFDLDYDELYETCMESELGYEIVKTKAEKPEVDKLNEFKRDRGIGANCVQAIEDTKRLYPNGSLASNVIGFTNYDNIGVYGIEAYYDDYLTGVDGLFVMARDANNQAMPYDYEMRYEAQNGSSLILTIDEVLQHYLEKNLEIAVSQHRPQDRATGIIMNAKTGAILAMATCPSFDLNSPSTLSDADYLKLEEIRTQKINDALILSGYSHGTADDLSEEQLERIDDEIEGLESVMRETQWKNKAITELYFPGSVFKVIPMASALEEHLIAPSTSFYCPGHSMVADTRINCWNLGGHGTVENLTVALTKSCNPAFIEIGRRLGVTRFTEYFEAFGFTKKTGIDLPGEANSLYMRAENMGPVELASSSIGQTNKVTPLQMITAFAATINGGNLVTPYVVDKIIDNEGNVIQSTEPNVKRQVISAETSAIMRQTLESVVEYNGGTNAYIEGYRIGGKSGTSQKIDDFPAGDRYVSSFCAFTPANDPEIIMLVMVDDPRSGIYYGSTVAAPVVSAVFKETLPYLEIYPMQLSEAELAQQSAYVPALVGLTMHEVITRLNSIGLEYRFVGEESGDHVTNTVPQGGQPISKGGLVIVYMSDDADYKYSTVPDVTGMSVAKTNEVMTNAGLNIKFTGPIQNAGAAAAYQSISPYEVVPSGTVIEVGFMFVDGHAG